MKNFLKSSALCLIALGFAAVCAASAGAQTREDRFILARAGGVNFVSGDVKARRAGGQEWQSVSVKENLRSGDAARTGADGRVEVLLSPGSYLRAGASTEFELTDASLEELRVRLSRGSAVIEASGYGDFALDIQITTPQTRVKIVRTGVYRIDVTPEGETVVSVQKGRALVGEGDAALTVKGGKAARVGQGGGAQLAKVEKKQHDSLDDWSRERGRELSKVNETLASRRYNEMLAGFNFVDMFTAEFPSNYYGIWMWSLGRNCYTFLPFYSGWRSPYGFGYGSFFSPFGTYDCWTCPRRTYRPMIVRTTDPRTFPTPSTTIQRGGFPAPSSTDAGTSNSGRVLTPRPSPSSVDDGGGRPTRVRTIEPGTRQRDQ